jgi:hypothetical protein
VASTFETIDDHLRDWIARQSMFFVGTAPLAADGRVNISPKGPIGTLAVLGPRRLAYLDFYGSGAETVAHLRENGRIVVMLCAFDGPPRIVRFHGTGTVIWPDDPRFDAHLDEATLNGLTDVAEARRAIVVVDVDRIADSCGYGVPLMEHVGEREHFDLSKRKRLRTMGPEEMVRFQAGRNAESIDGLPAVPVSRSQA